MRKVILYISASVDGFIADEFGSVSWINGQDDAYQSDYGYNKFIKTIDTVVLGWNTYKQIVEELSPECWPYQGMKSYVFTNNLPKPMEDITFIKGDIVSFINKIKHEAGKNIWICGGATVVNQLIEADAIDEYHITTIPILLGKGIRLFQGNSLKIKLRLKECVEENGIITGIYLKRN